MNNKETASEIRRWCATPRVGFSWPTDRCGYEQHTRFVTYRRDHYHGFNSKGFHLFALKYAAMIEAEPDPATGETP